MRSGAWIRSSAASSASENEFSGSRRCPSSRVHEACTRHDRRGRERAERDRLDDAAAHRRRRAAVQIAASARPAAIERERDEHDVEPHQAVLELGDHRGRRVAGRALPDAAVDGRDEVEDPRADRHAERDDRGGRRMLGQRRRRGGERDRQPGVQHVAERAPSPAPAGRRCRRSFATAATAASGASDAIDPAGRAARAPWPRCARTPASDAAARASARRSADRRRRGGWRRTAAGTPPRARRR